MDRYGDVDEGGDGGRLKAMDCRYACLEMEGRVWEEEGFENVKNGF